VSSADIKVHIAMSEGPLYEGSSIVINGVDISSCVSALTVECKVGEPARGIITIPVALLENVTAHPELCPVTRDALLALGWTPPAEGQPIRRLAHSAQA